MFENLVLSGGGIKGIAILGALKALVNHDTDMLKNINFFVGTSVGAVIAALIAIGYSPDELLNVMSSINPYDLKSIEPVKILTHFGIDSGAKIVKLFRTMISIKTGNPNMTFKQLLDKLGKTLIVTGTCVESGKVEYFGPETTPNIPICEALRLTISIPFIFSAVRFKEQTYVDGGVLNNFPMNVVQDKENVLGIRLTNHDDHTTKKPQIRTLEQFAISLVSGVINRMQELNTVEHKQEHHKIMYIDVGNISAVQFDISPEKRKDLFNIGLDIGTKFIVDDTNKKE